MPCRKCPACVRTLRIEWSNRMKLECLDKPYSPFFTTWTFAPENYSNSEKACKEDIQRFWKRLRRRGHDLRYFSVIERGEQNNRLHGHTVLWSESLSQLRQPEALRILHDVWGKGIVDLQKMRSKKGFGYVTKYMVKDLSMEGQRNYQWSKRDMLGHSGMEYWRKSLHDLYEDGVVFSKYNLPPNKMLIPVMGELDMVYIPKDAYVKFAKLLGVDFTPDNPLQYDKEYDPLLVSDGTSKPKIYRDEQLYRQYSQSP